MKFGLIGATLSHSFSKDYFTKKFERLGINARYENMIEQGALREADCFASRNPPKDATIKVIAPPEAFAVKRLTMDQVTLDAGYEMGIQAGEEHIAIQKGVYGLDIEDCHFCV